MIKDTITIFLILSYFIFFIIWLIWFHKSLKITKKKKCIHIQYCRFYSDYLFNKLSRIKNTFIVIKFQE